MWRMVAGAILAIAALTASPARAATAFGVRLGPGCLGVAARPAFEKFAGRRVEHVVDAFDQSSWPAFVSSIDWTSNCWKGWDAGLTISVPLLTERTPGSLEQGAAGRYDDTFRHVAAALVRDGHAHAIVRIGWEFNGSFQPWFAGKNPAAYIAYYRHVVALMRAQPGQHFRFEWTSASGVTDVAPDKAYPGDDVVDVIGADVYNEYWEPKYTDPQARWDWIQNRPYGVVWLTAFAKDHHKPVAFPEWGSGTRPDGHGGGDDPLFIQNMASWFKAADALYQCYWDAKDPTGIFDDRISVAGLHPKAAAAYLRYVARR